MVMAFKYDSDLLLHGDSKNIILIFVDGFSGAVVALSPIGVTCRKHC